VEVVVVLVSCAAAWELAAKIISVAIATERTIKKSPGGTDRTSLNCKRRGCQRDEP
jgi:hypothetical protein